MAYWLVKSEPQTWSFEEHKKAGIEPWDGVRNYQAANNLRAMKIGDYAFFYHSGDAREIVGIVQVVKEFYPDHTDKSEKFCMVDFKYIRHLSRPISLKEIKSDIKLQHTPLVKQSRLSVMPIMEQDWHYIINLTTNCE